MKSKEKKPVRKEKFIKLEPHKMKKIMGGGFSKVLDF